MKNRLLQFVYNESDAPAKTILFMLIAKAASSACIIYVINEAAQQSLLNTPTEIRMFFLFLLTGILYTWCLYYTARQIKIISKKIVMKVRVRLTDKLRKTELEFMESAVKGNIYARIVEDTDLISYKLPEALALMDTVCVCIFIFVYIAAISLTGLFFLVVLNAVLYGIFFLNYFHIRERLNAARQKESYLFELVNDTLSGFKEIKINSKKNDALFADILIHAEKTAELKKEGGFKNNFNIMLSFAVYVSLLGVAVFMVPVFSGAGNEVVIKLVTPVLFLFGPLDGISKIIPTFTQLNLAVENIGKLETELDNMNTDLVLKMPDNKDNFSKIILNSAAFRYKGKNGDTLFELSPVDLTIRQGEILFIVGGNGSGKSTLLKLITGLYYPLPGGNIILDEKPVAHENYQEYRELFSIIFTDFHIFKKLYGLESVDEKKVKHLLETMEIHRKTNYADGKFTNRDLSTGQRKRLAYIAARLEDKLVYIFDEWAADQDPTFRSRFYNEFLKDLKAMNKTVIAATHDDRYFDSADRVIRMEEGRIIAQ